MADDSGRCVGSVSTSLKRDVACDMSYYSPSQKETFSLVGISDANGGGCLPFPERAQKVHGTSQ